MVLASGEVLRTGSRTHKNKTGFDLLGLFVGSEGLLGVVTEATLRLLPLPPARATLSASFPHLPAGGECGAGGLSPRLSPLRAGDRRQLHAARPRASIVGTALVPAGRGHLLIDLDGQPASVRGEMRSLRALLQEAGALAARTAVGEAQCEKLWELAAQVLRIAEGDRV